MSLLRHKPSVVTRWLIFNSVGAMGIVVQIGVLMLLTSGVKLGYLPATGLAVEAAVLHNFFWHERWTWADRKMDRNGCLLRRLLCFHVTNGALSMAGNLGLMQLFVEKFGLNYLLANACAIALCSIFNFLAGDRIVFRSTGRIPKKGSTKMPNKSCRSLAQSLFLAAMILGFAVMPVEAAVLHPQTVTAWQAYVDTAERRMAEELSSRNGFLALDFQSSADAARERREALSGRIPIKQIAPGKRIPVPDGMIHHWRGSVFIPGVPLAFVLSRVEKPTAADTKQEDVLDSGILESSPGQLKLYLKLQRSKIVTVVYNTEHLVRYRWHGTTRASSSSIATKIAEIERLPENKEREKPEGQDRGFLWRMNSYWRYQQIDGGVLVECESMTLSRSIPPLLEYLIRPLINSTARESMQRTLQSTRSRMVQAYKSSPRASDS
jgi:putative flippase GtrA